MQLAPMAIGRIDMQYRRVECVPPSQMVIFVGTLHVSSGTIFYDLALLGGIATCLQCPSDLACKR